MDCKLRLFFNIIIVFTQILYMHIIYSMEIITTKQFT